MYKVVCVDDDYLVLEFLNHMIPWEELGFIVVGSFQNGKQALEHVKSEIVDVIITDIGMPIMDGIELIRNIKVLDPATHSIILSCHDDFNYAQQALKMNTFDYILKESMESEMIIDLLSLLKEKLDGERRSNMKKEQMEYLIKENMVALKSKLLNTLIEDKQDDSLAWWERQGNELGIDFAFCRCTPVVCFIDKYNEVKETFISDELLKFSIDNIVSETLNEATLGFNIFYKDTMFFVFYQHKDDVGENSFQFIQKSLKEIQSNIQHFMEISITTIIANHFQFPNDLVKQIKMMSNLSDQRFYMGNGSNEKMKQLNFSSENIFMYYSSALEELKSLIYQEDVDGLEESIQRWVSFMQNNRYPPKSVRDWFIQILLDIKLKFNSMYNFEPKFSRSVSDYLITNAESIYELETPLKTILLELVKNMKYVNGQPKKNEILKAQKYVLMNLNKKITLGEVADYLHLNHSYFSRMYKKNTNENFIDFVNRSKMESARELLDKSNETVEKISEKLGFDSKSYFLKTFKKYFGMPPIDYKYNSINNRKTENIL